MKCIFRIRVVDTSCNVGSEFYVSIFQLCRPVYSIYCCNLLVLGLSAKGLGFRPHLLRKPKMSF